MSSETAEMAMCSAMRDRDAVRAGPVGRVGQPGDGLR